MPLKIPPVGRTLSRQSMNNQPNTALAADYDLIDSMLLRQEQVLADLDNLFDRIDVVIADLNEQRKREAADAENILPFGPQLAKESVKPLFDLPASDEKAA